MLKIMYGSDGNKMERSVDFFIRGKDGGDPIHYATGPMGLGLYRFYFKDGHYQYETVEEWYDGQQRTRSGLYKAFVKWLKENRAEEYELVKE